MLAPISAPFQMPNLRKPGLLSLADEFGWLSEVRTHHGRDLPHGEAPPCRKVDHGYYLRQEPGRFKDAGHSVSDEKEVATRIALSYRNRLVQNC